MNGYLIVGIVWFLAGALASHYSNKFWPRDSVVFIDVDVMTSEETLASFLADWAAVMENGRPTSEAVDITERLISDLYVYCEGIQSLMEEPCYTCPRCGRISYNVSDIEHRYCGNCHTYEYNWTAKQA